MDNTPRDYEISAEDLRAALKEINVYVDITEDDLMKIYAIALKHAQERLALKIPVSDVMTKDVVTVNKDVNIHEVARILSESKISGVPVIDEANHVTGVVTERDILYIAGMRKHHTFKDILRHVLGEPMPRRNKQGTEDTVEETMSSLAITTNPDADIKEVAMIMNERRIKRLPVVDNKNKLIGIISRADIVSFMGKQ